MIDCIICLGSRDPKWLSAPKGYGFLYARPEQQLLLLPLIVSWGWEAELPSSSLVQDYFGWTGTADPAAYLSVPAAIGFQQRYDWASGEGLICL